MRINILEGGDSMDRDYGDKKHYFCTRVLSEKAHVTLLMRASITTMDLYRFNLWITNVSLHIYV